MAADSGGTISGGAGAAHAGGAPAPTGPAARLQRPPASGQGRPPRAGRGRRTAAEQGPGEAPGPSCGTRPPATCPLPPGRAQQGQQPPAHAPTRAGAARLAPTAGLAAVSAARSEQARPLTDINPSLPPHQREPPQGERAGVGRGGRRQPWPGSAWGGDVGRPEPPPRSPAGSVGGSSRRLRSPYRAVSGQICTQQREGALGTDRLRPAPPARQRPMWGSAPPGPGTSIAAAAPPLAAGGRPPPPTASCGAGGTARAGRMRGRLRHEPLRFRGPPIPEPSGTLMLAEGQS